MQPLNYSLMRGLKVGAQGGLIGAIVLGLLAGLGAVALNQEVFYVTVAKKLGFGDSAVLGGWALHFLVGIIAGAVFIGITGQVKSLALANTRKSLWVGILAGIAIWIVIYVPVTGLIVPTDLTDLMFAGGSFIFHMVYGVVTATVAFVLLRRNVKTTLAK